MPGFHPSSPPRFKETLKNILPKIHLAGNEVSVSVSEPVCGERENKSPHTCSAFGLMVDINLELRADASR